MNGQPHKQKFRRSPNPTKSADPSAVQSPQAPSPRRRSFNLRDVMFKVLDFFFQVVSVPINIIEFFTGAKGSAYLFGILAAYMLLINAEGYLQSFGGRNGFPDFTWKPFINDPSAILQLIPTLFDRPLEFGAGFALSTAVQAIQAWAIRDWTADEAKSELDEAMKCKRPELDPKVTYVDKAHLWRDRYKKHGMKSESHKGVLLFGVYAVDIIVAYANYPFLGVLASRLFANLIWFFLSVAGSELFFNASRDAQKRARAADKLKVEIV